MEYVYVINLDRLNVGPVVDGSQAQKASIEEWS